MRTSGVGDPAVVFDRALRVAFGRGTHLRVRGVRLVISLRALTSLLEEHHALELLLRQLHLVHGDRWGSLVGDRRVSGGRRASGGVAFARERCARVWDACAVSSVGEPVVRGRWRASECAERAGPEVSSMT